jgi:hypothetical protein
VRGVCGSLKILTVEDLKNQVTTVGALAKIVLKNPKFKTSYSDDERKQVATLIAEAVHKFNEKFNETSRVEAASAIVDEPATQAKPTLQALLHEKLKGEWLTRLDLQGRWKQESRNAVRENVLKFLDQSTGVTSTTDMHNNQYADRADVEAYLHLLQTNGRTLVDSTIGLAREGDFDVRKNVLEATKEAVVRVVPVLWLDVFNEVRHNRSYLSAQPRAARLRTRAV